MKINTDGSSIILNSTYGGLARTDQGRWIKGYCGFIGAALAITGKLWCIRQALKLAKEHRWKDVEIESDSVVTVRGAR